MNWYSGRLEITFIGKNTASIYDISLAQAQAWIRSNHAEGSSYMYYPYPTSLTKE